VRACMIIQINPVVYILYSRPFFFLHLIDYPSFQMEQNTRCCLNNFGRHACYIYIYLEPYGLALVEVSFSIE
jgi:hypothetical protein